MSNKFDISIITFYLGGRERYLCSAFNSVISDVSGFGPKIEYHIIGQGCEIPKYITELVDYGLPVKVNIHQWDENIGIGAGLNKIMEQVKGKLIFKMDDDCKIISDNFFHSAMRIHNKFPLAVFSPYPVGLINNPGGPRGTSHTVWHDKETDKYYTRRHVCHVGGFARFTPYEIIKDFKFSPDLIDGISGNEDGQQSTYCYNNNIDMFYLENGLIVEHQESTFGQIARYPNYFSNRNNEKSMYLKLIE